MRKIFVVLAVVAALLAGLVMWDKSLFGVLVRQGAVESCASLLSFKKQIFMLGSVKDEGAIAALYLKGRDVTREELLDLRVGSQAELLEHAKRRPDRPDRLWPVVFR